jgi:uncharacterized glyoxalase superfamily protein PhnB
MKPTPKGWPRLSTTVVYKDAAKAIDWLCAAFGFEVRLKVEGEGGVIEHSELVFGEAVIMPCDERRQQDKGWPMVSPRSVGGSNTQSIMLYVDDVDAHCARARAAGGTITIEPAVSDYGEEYWADKSYQCEDLEGHRWWFCERVRG